MYKVRNNLSPEYLCEMLNMHSSFLENTNTNMTLRSISNQSIHVPRPRTEMFKGSLTYSGAIIWNSIPINVRNSCSVRSFTNQCVKWLKDNQIHHHHVVHNVYVLCIICVCLRYVFEKCSFMACVNSLYSLRWVHTIR